jgi:cytoskeletal protein RodZ
MKFEYKNSLLVLVTIFCTIFVFACSTQQSAETKPAANSAATTQPKPAAQPNAPTNQVAATEPGKALQPAAPASKEPEVELSLPMPAASAAVGSVVTMPITINSKSDKQIFSYSLAVMFDPNVLQPTEDPVNTKGTLSDGFMIASDTKTSGRLGVAAASASKSVKPNGTLLNTQFKIIGKPTDKMSLKIAQTVFEDENGNKLNVSAKIKE